MMGEALALHVKCAAGGLGSHTRPASVCILIFTRQPNISQRPEPRIPRMLFMALLLTSLYCFLTGESLPSLATAEIGPMAYLVRWLIWSEGLFGPMAYLVRWLISLYEVTGI